MILTRCSMEKLIEEYQKKLDDIEKMYQMICDSTAQAFLYVSFAEKKVTLLGKWSSFFDFTITQPKEISKIYNIVDEPYMLPLCDILFLEKSGKGEADLECLSQDKRTWFRFHVVVYYGEDNNPTNKLICITNITKYRAQSEELIYMSYYDTVTGLYNRNYFVRLLGEFINKAKEEQTTISVLVIDVDDFHKVNDGLGIIAGDELVQQFGDVLKEFCGENIIVCHLTSDVYCMAIYNPSGEYSAEEIHKKIQKRVKTPFRLSGGQELDITVSIGVAQYPEAASSALELINCAEIVMFKGKEMGKNNIQYFDTLILNDFLKNIEIENKLKEAVFNNNFLLHFQPQYYIKGGEQKLRGVEALIRWKDEQDRMISPAVFIPIAEKNGTIVSIGQWVVEQSVRQYAKWKHQYGYSMVMSINISAIQCKREDFTDNLLRVLGRYQISPREIELEITESILIDDFQAVCEKLTLLKEYGVRISLDDFGTGFSSLSYLKKLPIDTLKIDKSFIDTVLTDSATRIITESIVNMVKTLGFESIAEGVENEEQFKYLHTIGCDIIQGYFLGKPQTAEQIEQLLVPLKK